MRKPGTEKGAVVGSRGPKSQGPEGKGPTPRAARPPGHPGAPPAGAFGGNGVLVPQRRSAGITAVVWRTSAGTAARLPIALATNLTRTLRAYAAEGLMIVGLDADSDTTVDELELATSPLIVVVGSEGRGLSRLVKEDCDATVSLPTDSGVESLNASVAAGVVLAEV